MSESVNTQPISLPPATPAPRRYWLFFLFAFYVVWGLRATVFYGIDRRLGGGVARELYAHLLRLLIWLLPLFGFLRLVERVAPLAYLKLTTRLRAPLMGFSLVLLYLLGIYGFEYLVNGKNIWAAAQRLSLDDWLQGLGWAFLAPVVEEVFYRGFVLQKLTESLPFWAANLLTALLFLLIHLPYWLYTGMAFVPIARLSVPILLLALMLGYLVRKSDSLYPSILLHLLNNWSSMVYGRLR